MNFKTNTWKAALLLVASTVFAQDNGTMRPQKNCFDGPKTCIDQGHEMAKCQMLCAYSAPARIEVRGSWDIYASGSYLYWQAREENLDLGLVSNTNTPIATIGSQSHVKHPHFTYRSGFKVGLGINFDYDNWDALAEYTWFHGTIHSNFGGSTAPSTTSVIFPEQLHPSADGLNTTYYYGAKQSWNLKMDFVDLVMARSYYSGTKLTVRPYFGARGAWIRQTQMNAYTGSAAAPTGSGSDVANSTSSSVSQGIGPRAGLDANCLVGYGMRLIGNTSGDILYTRYGAKYHQNVTPIGAAATQNFYVKEKHGDYLRAHAALDLGFGWGSYFDNHNWHVDFSATYGFQVFWNQNMFRYFSNDMFGKSFTPNGNLYVHGVTANARLDF